jgi:hypothetical protein
MVGWWKRGLENGLHNPLSAQTPRHCILDSLLRKCWGEGCWWGGVERGLWGWERRVDEVGGSWERRGGWVSVGLWRVVEWGDGGGMECGDDNGGGDVEGE